MEFRGYRHGSESQDSDEPVPPGTVFDDKAMQSPSASTPSPVLSTSSKGVENAKKRLRAFSIQKKAPVGPVTVVKPVCTGNTTVLIGKLCSTKVTPKPDKPVDDEKKLPKPPKPGGSKKYLNESYSELQKKTLSEIEEMKRKLELVELGIPLGLVCPSTNALPVKAMPTKAMPPIKTFLADSFRVVDARPPAKKIVSVKKTNKLTIENERRTRNLHSPHNAKIDEIIREARKAKAEGKEFKFDYQKFVPDYDNPFQRKRDLLTEDPDKSEIVEKKEEEYKKPRFDKDKRFHENKDKDRRKSDKFDRRRDFKRDDRLKFADKIQSREKDKKEEHRNKGKDDRSRDRELKSKDRDDKYKKDERSVKKDVDEPKDKTKVEQKGETKKSIEKFPEKQKDKDGKETDVNLNDYLVCDSWSLDTEGKNSPQVDNKPKRDVQDKFKKLIGDITTPIDPLEQLRQSLGRKTLGSPKPRIEKLKPVVDCFEFEIDPNEDELEVFDGKGMKLKKDGLYDLPVPIKYDMRKDLSSDGMNDDIFLESVINEIKQENMSDDEHHDKGLVEYDESPARDSNEPSIGSVTPDLEDSIRSQSQRSDYSDGYKSVDSHRSTESGYKSTESGYKSEGRATESSYKSDAKFADGNFKSIEPTQKSNENEDKSDYFKSTFRPAENQSEPAEIRSRSSESHSRSPNQGKDHSKYSEGNLKHDPGQKSKSKIPKEERESLSVDKELDEALEVKMSKDTVDSLETWSFVLKICQPLLFRHDKDKCYKETRTVPKLWFAQNPKLCDCVMDRAIVYEELERCKMDLVDRLYVCDQIPEPPLVIARAWYPRVEQCVVALAAPLQLASEWDVEEEARPGPRAPAALPRRNDDESLDREYQRFMEAVSWADTQEGRSLTPEQREQSEPSEPRAKRARATSDGWSQDSEPDTDNKAAAAKTRARARLKRRRKPSPAPSPPSPAPAPAPAPADPDRSERRKRKAKKKNDKKTTKLKAKRRKIEKKMLKEVKKLKEKKKKKKERVQDELEFEDEEEMETKKKDKKVKKKKQQKLKKKAEKKKKRARSTSSSSSDSSSSDSSSDQRAEKRARRKKELQAKKKKKKEKKKKRRQSSSDSASSELFDVNILNNIKAERLTDDERPRRAPAAPPSPPSRPPREIINVNQLHDHFSSNVQIKQEVEDEANTVQPPKESPKTIETQEEAAIITEEESTKEKEDSNEGEETAKIAEEVPKKVEVTEKPEEVPKSVKEVPKKVERVSQKVESQKVEVAKKLDEFRRVESEAELMNRFDLDEQYSAAADKPEKTEFKPTATVQQASRDEGSQCSSQESQASATSARYETDDEHLRPSCDNSNYSFNDVINSQAGYKTMEEKFEEYENYEIYEQMAMAYQSDVASQQISPPSCMGEQRIETVVRAHARGEIKCDWRASDGPAPATQRPSRWGLKPGEVNIVLTGGGDQLDSREQAATTQPVYKIQSLANRDSSIGYDEAYMDMYGAADRLQYGDCFAPAPAPPPPPPPPPRASKDPRITSLDARISRALRNTVLSEVARDENGDKETPEKGILITPRSVSRGSKRVSFADGYRPGQDSDTEQPPARKRSRVVTGCAWPCPATHPAHVPLWDALPPPPPPPGSPPPARPSAPPLHLLRRPSAPPALSARPHRPHHKMDPAATIPNFMPPEPPPGLISFS